MKYLKNLPAILSLGLVLSLFTSASLSKAAEGVCIKDVKGFQSNKDKFPVVFQKLPILLSVNNSMVTAGLKIEAVGSKIKFKGSVWSPRDLYNDDEDVTEICYDGKTVKVTLENGKKYSAYINGSTVSIQGQTLSRATPAAYAGIVNKIQAKINGSSSQVASQVGAQ